MTKIKNFYANAAPETPEAYAVRIALEKLPGELRIQFFNWLGSDKINKNENFKIWFGVEEERKNLIAYEEKK